VTIHHGRSSDGLRARQPRPAGKRDRIVFIASHEMVSADWAPIC